VNLIQPIPRPAGDTRLAGSGFRVITQPGEVEAWLRTHSIHPLSLLLKNEGGRVFADADGAGIGFFETPGAVLSIGGVVPGARTPRAVLDGFLDWCAAARRKPRFVHFSAADAAMLDAAGFHVEQIGASFALDFDSAALEGKAYRQVRRKLQKAGRAGMRVEEICTRERFAELRGTIDAINAEWQRAKRAKPLRRLVYAFDLVAPSADERVFVAWHGDEIIAYLVFSRVLRNGSPVWFHNLSRRRTGCADGTMQSIVSQFLESSGAGTLHFGFTPLVEMAPPTMRHSALFAKVARWLSRRGGVVYPARAQRQYKMSWSPTEIIPEFFAYREPTLAAALGLLRSTNSI
jgi:lysylphosphatidylglycerol synthetase-like protein (DUF2156 family)